jgi:hypothetical protein
MTRRDRHVRILHNFGGLRSLTGSRTVAAQLDHLLYQYGLELLTDEAVEILTRAVWRSHRRAQRMNAHNRAQRMNAFLRAAQNGRIV